MFGDFQPVPEEVTRIEIRNPKGLSLVDLPRSREGYESIDGKLLIHPEGFPDTINPVVGARTAEKGDVVWTREELYEMLGVDPKKVVRIQQKHTANVREITSDMAGAGSLDAAGEDTRVRTEDGKGLDAAWTKQKDITLMIGTADCAAILIAGKDKDGQDVAGIAHAGIAGAQGDVVGNLTREMIKKADIDPKTINVYAGPDICERCYSVLSDDPSNERVDKMPFEKMLRVREDGEEFEIEVTKLTAAVLRFKDMYNDAFKEISGRDLAENDFYYIDQDGKGSLDLHLNLNMFIYLSLIGNKVNPDNIGFSNICSAHDTLPSNRRTQETTGIFSTISIK